MFSNPCFIPNLVLAFVVMLFKASDIARLNLCFDLRIVSSCFALCFAADLLIPCAIYLLASALRLTEVSIPCPSCFNPLNGIVAAFTPKPAAAPVIFADFARTSPTFPEISAPALAESSAPINPDKSPINPSTVTKPTRINKQENIILSKFRLGSNNSISFRYGKIKKNTFIPIIAPYAANAFDIKLDFQLVNAFPPSNGIIAIIGGEIINKPTISIILFISPIMIL